MRAPESPSGALADDKPSTDQLNREAYEARRAKKIRESIVTRARQALAMFGNPGERMRYKKFRAKKG